MAEQLTYLNPLNNEIKRYSRTNCFRCCFFLIFLACIFIFNFTRDLNISPDYHTISKNKKVDLAFASVNSNRKNNNIASASHQCKTLWFAGFHCGKDSFLKYSRHYAAALQSALEMTNKILQPVVLMGFLGVDEETKFSTEILTFKKWAKDLGVKVIALDQLSFSKLTTKYLNNTPLYIQQGAYLRLDIPNVIENHDLYNNHIDNNHDTICNDAVLYTDSDVVFSKVSFSDLVKAKSLVTSSNTSSMMAYGPQHSKTNTGTPENTGVMILNPSRFKLELPNILNFAVDHKFGNGSWHDQNLLNEYFKQPGGFSQKRSFLPAEWNYKPYWGKSSNIKIVHFHGIKPGRLLDCLASSNMASPLCKKCPNPCPKHTLYVLVTTGLEADGGVYAREVLNFYYALPSWDGSNNTTPAKKKYDLYINGPKRGKCNWNCYVNNYQDVKIKDAKTHFINIGISEGRNCACSGGKGELETKNVT